MERSETTSDSLTDAAQDAGPGATSLGVLAHGDAAGCACKADWALMDELLQLQLVGGALPSQLGLDDAAFVRPQPQFAMAASIDFIGPVARSAADYGYVAAAHAMSDLFAVGATPTHALVVAAWPRDPAMRGQLPAALEGMRRAMANVGAALLGGHTAFSEQPLLGLSAFGRLEHGVPMRRKIESADAIYLTKPLGVGVAIGAMREGHCPPDLERASLETMRTLNTAGLDLARSPSVKLVSDVTGFGLLGQALRLAEKSGLSVRIDGAALPALPKVRSLIQRGIGSSAAERNWGMMKDKLSWRHWPDIVLAGDPQTNGPLLVVGDEGLDALDPGLVRIGTLLADQGEPMCVY